MVSRNTRAGVLGVEHGISHQLGYVVVLDPVEDLRTFLTGLNQPGHP